VTTSKETSARHVRVVAHYQVTGSVVVEVLDCGHVGLAYPSARKHPTVPVMRYCDLCAARARRKRG
jgi:hypothetical protein